MISGLPESPPFALPKGIPFGLQGQINPETKIEKLNKHLQMSSCCFGRPGHPTKRTTFDNLKFFSGGGFAFGGHREYPLGGPKGVDKTQQKKT